MIIMKVAKSHIFGNKLSRKQMKNPVMEKPL